MSTSTAPSPEEADRELTLDRLDVQRHALEPVAIEKAFARLAVEHPECCTRDETWQPLPKGGDA